MVALERRGSGAEPQCWTAPLVLEENDTVVEQATVHYNWPVRIHECGESALSRTRDRVERRCLGRFVACRQRDTGFRNLGMDVYRVSAPKIFVSTPHLRNMVPLLQPLVASDNNDPPYKCGCREPKRWGRSGDKRIPGDISAIPTDTETGYSSGTPTVRFSTSKPVWRVVVVNSYQKVEKYGNKYRR